MSKWLRQLIATSSACGRTWVDLWVPHEMILMIGDISEMGRAPVVFTPAAES